MILRFQVKKIKSKIKNLQAGSSETDWKYK